MGVRHRAGLLKQVNKPHKGVKKRLRLTESNKKKNKVKHQSKKERRMANKQRRLSKVKQLKKCHDIRGSRRCPLLCVVIPLVPKLPVNLALRLFTKCCSSNEGSNHRNNHNNAMDVTVENSMTPFQSLYNRYLDKHFTIASASPDNLFACLDLAQLADWIVLVAPSDVNQLSAERTDQFLTTLYSHGLPNTLYAVMSSGFDSKEVKQTIITRYPVPDDIVYSLNTTDHALDLLRHMSQSSVQANITKLKQFKGIEQAVGGHSSSRFRAGLLVESIDVVDVSQSENNTDTCHLRVTGQLRGSPLFLHEKLDQLTSSAGSSSGGPILHLPGWSDLPLVDARWHPEDPSLSYAHQWSLQTDSRSWLKANNDDKSRSEGGVKVIPDQDEDQHMLSADEDADYEESSGASSTIQSDDDARLSVSSDEDQMTLDDENSEDEQSDNATDLLSNYAARSSIGSTYSTAQLAKFRAARSDEMFPDEVETLPGQSAAKRFHKYRSLPRFRSSRWPVEQDILPKEYDKITCFTNYNRNRRSIQNYLRRRLLAHQRQNCHEYPLATPPDLIPVGSRVQLTLGPLPAKRASLIQTKHTDLLVNPLVAFALLPHERHLSVCHFLVKRSWSSAFSQSASDLVVMADAANKAADQELKRHQSMLEHNQLTLELGEEADSGIKRQLDAIKQAVSDHRATRLLATAAAGGIGGDGLPLLPPSAEPIKSKELMLYQAGIRRFVASPIYSSLTSSPNEKAKMEKYLSASSTGTIATIYGPVMYAPVNVLQFRVRVQDLEDEYGDVVDARPYIGELVATGSLHSVDPSRLVIKRIFLSGHPYKINKRHVVVRYMFFQPKDVEFFKTVPLQTKMGALGHIKESVGTHGHMKCAFDRQLNSSDVVLMPLYKRVFPKWVYHANIAEVVDSSAPALEDDEQCEKMATTEEWSQAPDTLQLTRRKPSKPMVGLAEDENEDEEAIRRRAFEQAMVDEMMMM